MDLGGIGRQYGAGWGDFVPNAKSRTGRARPHNPLRILFFGLAALPIGVFTGCHETPQPATPEPQAVPAPPAPATYRSQPTPNDGNFGDLIRETDWRRRTADRLRRMP